MPHPHRIRPARTSLPRRTGELIPSASMTDPDSVPKADTVEETDMVRLRKARKKQTGKAVTTDRLRAGVRTISRVRRTFRRTILVAELLAGALLVALEVRDQMEGRVPDSETEKVLAEARSIPQTVLRAIKGAVTQGAGTKKETESTRT